MNAGEGGSDAWPGAITTRLNLPDRYRSDDSLGHHLPTAHPAVESTDLAACLQCDSFQHLRGRMFCGALAKCDLAIFGCDYFHQLGGPLADLRTVETPELSPEPLKLLERDIQFPRAESRHGRHQSEFGLP